MISRRKFFWYKFFMPCFGDWNCLTDGYRRGNGMTAYESCKLRTKCRLEKYRKERIKEKKDLLKLTDMRRDSIRREKERRLIAEQERNR